MSRKVVIADDSITARLVTKQCLQVAGFGDAEVIERDNGLHAYVAVKENRPELLLTDLIMPQMDGTELLRRIKADEALKDTRVIVITSAGNDAKEQELLALGAEAVITKPISPAKLVNVLNPPSAEDGFDGFGGFGQ